MATLVAIAYPDEDTAEQARASVWQLEADLIIEADEVAVISAIRKATITSASATAVWEAGSLRPGGATARGLTERDLVAISGAPRESS